MFDNVFTQTNSSFKTSKITKIHLKNLRHTKATEGCPKKKKTNKGHWRLIRLCFLYVEWKWDFESSSFLEGLMEKRV